jgi:copper chaperone CopZ
MKKVEGVQSVQVSLKEGLTVLELRPANKVTLAQLRTVIKNSGFVSKDAQVAARGSVAGDSFEVCGSGERLPFVQKPTETDGLWRFVSPKS